MEKLPKKTEFIPPLIQGILPELIEQCDEIGFACEIEFTGENILDLYLTNIEPSRGVTERPDVVMATKLRDYLIKHVIRPQKSGPSINWEEIFSVESDDTGCFLRFSIQNSN